MRELTPKSSTRIAATEDTYLIVQPFALIIGCLHCGGTRNHVTFYPRDWTAEEFRVHDLYLRESLVDCLCNVDHARFRSLAADLASAREANAVLAMEKLEVERERDVLRRLVLGDIEVEGESETGEVQTVKGGRGKDDDKDV